MDEFSFINSIKQKSYQQSTVIKGIGDDAAVIRQQSKDIVTAVDTLVHGVHFSTETMQPFQVGYRALAANISDLAAMGASPAFYLVSITIPDTLGERALQDMYSGMRHIASTYQMDLIGGDTVSGKEWSVTITVIGYVDKGRARYRSLAEENDVVFVTGTVGDSQAGLYILQHSGNYINQNYFINRHVKPEPRVSFARALRNIQRMALNDISDGIANEAAELAEASNVALILDSEKIPISPFLSQFPCDLQYKWKLFGGEDFELLGTVSEKDWSHVQFCAKELQLPVTQIGKVVHRKTSDGHVFLKQNKQQVPLNKKGYTHLRR
ncbi:thiamine-phosphate kinase [Virgibacillus sp. W0430]|uniref:thiamine-phosphate kinase n=1 Tax=Virgibacillus sp. W0430 TaxID=3391580 RepID=UPI003F477E22